MVVERNLKLRQETSDMLQMVLSEVFDAVLWYFEARSEPLGPAVRVAHVVTF